MHNVMRDSFPHFHSHIEILMINRGFVDVVVDGTLYSLSQGECILIFPGFVHSYLNASDDNDVLLIVCANHLTGNFGHWLTSKYPPNPVLHHLNSDSAYALSSITSIRDSIPDLYTLPETHAIVEHLALLIQLFLSASLFGLKLEKRIYSEEQELSQKVVNYVLKEYCNSITLDDIANSLHLNRFRVSRIFSNQLHISFPKFLNELRIEEAKQLLSNTDMPITNISFECGFSTLRTFNRVFLDTTGKSPKQYRSDKIDK